MESLDTIVPAVIGLQKNVIATKACNDPVTTISEVEKGRRKR